MEAHQIPKTPIIVTSYSTTPIRPTEIIESSTTNKNLTKRSISEVRLSKVPIRSASIDCQLNIQVVSSPAAKDTVLGSGLGGGDVSNSGRSGKAGQHGGGGSGVKNSVQEWREALLKREASFDLTDEFAATAGLRKNRDRKIGAGDVHPIAMVSSSPSTLRTVSMPISSKTPDDTTANAQSTPPEITLIGRAESIALAQVKVNMNGRMVEDINELEALIDGDADPDAEADSADLSLSGNVVPIVPSDAECACSASSCFSGRSFDHFKDHVTSANKMFALRESDAKLEAIM
eukprot:CAMPEP_0184699210 /NCGR_PEP_ID=MMETSP0313-20130426/5561_1 /TAXON_ID=2792 /ORGANISM="Porphyridium aerugineum, Strain SAG 1380-2" /LENGTH=289 /DNA_ID=CAMNT_0027158265 /DNA_START=465 /DNA_END=1334 /DNA_ORIENTATION=+